MPRHSTPRRNSLGVFITPPRSDENSSTSESITAARHLRKRSIVGIPYTKQREYYPRRTSQRNSASHVKVQRSTATWQAQSADLNASPPHRECRMGSNNFTITIPEDIESGTSPDAPTAFRFPSFSFSHPPHRRASVTDGVDPLDAGVSVSCTWAAPFDPGFVSRNMQSPVKDRLASSRNETSTRVAATSSHPRPVKRDSIQDITDRVREEDVDMASLIEHIRDISALLMKHAKALDSSVDELSSILMPRSPSPAPATPTLMSESSTGSPDEEAELDGRLTSALHELLVIQATRGKVGHLARILTEGVDRFDCLP